jgi:hypothetical protein
MSPNHLKISSDTLSTKTCISAAEESPEIDKDFEQVMKTPKLVKTLVTSLMVHWPCDKSQA